MTVSVSLTPQSFLARTVVPDTHLQSETNRHAIELRCASMLVPA
jgi:hypothetical protein